MTIHAETFIPEIPNEHSDCGVLAAIMIEQNLRNVNAPITESDLETARLALDKTTTEGTMPNRLVNYLQRTGADVTYFSAIDWESLSHTPLAELNALAESLSSAVGEPGMINPLKLQTAAKQLAATTSPANPETIGQDIQNTLQTEGFVVLMINSNHYIVLYGIDEDGSYILYDPNIPKDPDNPSKYYTAPWDKLSKLLHKQLPNNFETFEILLVTQPKTS